MLSRIRDWDRICIERQTEAEGRTCGTRQRSWEFHLPWGGGAAGLRVQAGTGGAAAEGGSPGTRKGGCGPC